MNVIIDVDLMMWDSFLWKTQISKVVSAGMISHENDFELNENPTNQ